ncbi:MAG TPA: glycosyltransferase family 2 protein [Candidatus Fermentibacter daniensis]|nr:MAG: Undecaprenyl-phosphate 4-deoxy-4-formamido-L-arabinose transferase [candidate division Hyd24-12 bacterium ADurb.Bin004]HOZ18720.1 glycosyltransferase family 2 protein [Candidatus Fermentibacter daniensis]HPH40725.1 glycosyltransferase family 2 protein [Candidatus Fermentibacter daniensis]
MPADTVEGISLVVPVYESRESLEILAKAVSEAMAEIGGPWELILVDDASSDGSWEVVRRLAAADPGIRGMRLARNSGQHNALLCGIRAARFSVTVTLDDDLQNPPTEIPKLLAKLSEGFDVVYGSPDRERHGLPRDLASRLTKIVLQKSMGVATASRVSAFRAFRTSIRDSFVAHSGPYCSIDVLLTWGTRNFGAVTVRHEARTIGRSHYTFGKLVTHAFNMITGFSTIPLEIASMAGFVFMLFGIGVLLYVLIRYFVNGGSVPGFPFLASIISIFSGVQLFSLGVIGEYIARMHFRLMGIPGYTISERVE